jgi:hypothetical protein
MDLARSTGPRCSELRLRAPKQPFACWKGSPPCLASRSVNLLYFVTMTGRDGLSPVGAVGQDMGLGCP